MKIAYVKGKSTTIVLSDAELGVALNFVLGVIENYGGKTQRDLLQLVAIKADMEYEMAVRAKRKADAERYHLCCKCFKEVDTRKDEFHHSVFPTGDSIWFHTECPPVNEGEGYAN